MKAALPPSTPTHRCHLPAFILGAAAAALLALPVTARAQFYVASTNGAQGLGSVGEYDLVGSTVTADLITGLFQPNDMVLSGSTLFVAGATSGGVGEYTLSAGTVTAANGAFISGLGQPVGLAISTNDLFVSDTVNGTIGEYNATTGAAINASLVTGLGTPTNLALSGNDIYVLSNGTIGEYNATTGAAINASLVTGTGATYGLALSGNGNDLFVNTGTAIAEYDATTGAAINTALITGLSNGPEGIAVSGTTLLVANNGISVDGAGTIGEYDVSGAAINSSLVTGLYESASVAFTPVPEPYWAGLAALVPIAFLAWKRNRQVSVVCVPSA